MNFIIPPTSSRLTYYGDWVDQGNGAWKFCQNSCAVTLSFNGTQISYSGYQEDRAGLMQAVIDNMNPQEFDGSIGANPDGSRVQATLFTQKSLSSTETHFINVSYAGVGSGGGNYASFFNFNFIQDNTSGNLNINHVPSSSTTSPSHQASSLPSFQQSSSPFPSQSLSSTSPSQSNSSLPLPASLNSSPSEVAIPISSSTGAVVSTSPSTSSVPAGATSALTHSSDTAAIVGGVLGGLIFLVVLITLLVRNRYKNRGFFGSSSSQRGSDLSPFNMQDHPDREEAPSSPKRLMSETRFTDPGPSTGVYTSLANQHLDAPGIQEQAFSENNIDDDQYTLVDRDRVWEARAHICV